MSRLTNLVWPAPLIKAGPHSESGIHCRKSTGDRPFKRRRSWHCLGSVRVVSTVSVLFHRRRSPGTDRAPISSVAVCSVASKVRSWQKKVAHVTAERFGMHGKRSTKRSFVLRATNIWRLSPLVVTTVHNTEKDGTPAESTAAALKIAVRQRSRGRTPLRAAREGALASRSTPRSRSLKASSGSCCRTARARARDPA